MKMIIVLAVSAALALHSAAGAQTVAVRSPSIKLGAKSPTALPGPVRKEVKADIARSGEAAALSGAGAPAATVRKAAPMTLMQDSVPAKSRARAPGTVHKTTPTAAPEASAPPKPLF